MIAALLDFLIILVVCLSASLGMLFITSSALDRQPYAGIALATLLWMVAAYVWLFLL